MGDTITDDIDFPELSDDVSSSNGDGGPTTTTAEDFTEDTSSLIDLGQF